jgi:AAA domain
VLRVLADLAPSTEQHATGLSVPTDWFRWLPIYAVHLFQELSRSTDPAKVFLAAAGQDLRAVSIDRPYGDQLAAIDQVRGEAPSLRVGWLFVAGRMTTEEGRTRRVFHPLVTVPVRVVRSAAPLGAHLVPAGDPQVSPLVTDSDLRHQLEDTIEIGGGALSYRTVAIAPALLARLGRLRHYARSVASAAGLPAGKIVAAEDEPDRYMRSDGLVIVAGVGVYANREVGETSQAASLRAWASSASASASGEWTAFHSSYLERPSESPATAPVPPTVESPYLLTPVQRRAVGRSRREPITLISGAPGTGKSHTIAAIACDALGNGERVLVAAKSDATVDALLDLLERAPGPDPVVFGSNERREALAKRLSRGQLEAQTDDTVSAARGVFEAAVARRDEIHATVAHLLAAEALLDAGAFSGADGCDPTAAARSLAPGLFEAGCDLARAESLLKTVSASGSVSGSGSGEGWWARHHGHQAREHLDVLCSSSSETGVQDLRAAVAVAHAVRASVELQIRGGLEIGPLWSSLLRADDEARNACARWLACDSRSWKHLNHTTLPAVAALATALRSGRSARRVQLRRLDDNKVSQALPLWVGTLADVDDLLPPVSGLFDLVILDEASSIDQPLAATALLRGRRAVIAGDPQQLRHVSFVSDAQFRAAVTAQGLDGFPVLAARLDIRRNSAFDLAAGSAPVLVLDEHFRSDPHLVDFVAQRLYDGTVQVATRCPTTESKDCVEVVRTDGRRDKDGVVGAEVDRAILEVGKLMKFGLANVGIVTPFRAQADALEEAAIDAFSADELEALDLRVGTVHAFQGNERDVVILSLGIGPDEGPGSWRFVEDPHLFAVMMTRARRRMTILCSADPPEGGLMADYLAQADAPPGPPKPAREVREVDSWARCIADDLDLAGVPTIVAYPTGRHVVDVCIADESRNIGIECGVHPDGPEAHMERHLALCRRGWELLEAYPSRWGDRRAELIVELVGQLKQGRSRSGVGQT